MSSWCSRCASVGSSNDELFDKTSAPNAEEWGTRSRACTQSAWPVSSLLRPPDRRSRSRAYAFLDLHVNTSFLASWLQPQETRLVNILGCRRIRASQKS